MFDYVDPRNHRGASFVAHYLELMRDADRLARELDSLEVSLALLTLADADHDLLLGYLDGHSDWQVVYLDGHAVVYARVTERNRQLLERFGAQKVANAVGAADLDRLLGGE